MEILADAIEADTDQQSRVLDEKCGSDHALRSDVEELLAHRQTASTFMERAPVRALHEEQGLIGANIGPYQIIERLGHGGMGAVYLAERHDDEYKKKVAIKFIKHGLALDIVQRRFRNERQILANLDHQNIARLLDGGTTNYGPYLVMEYVKGLPIDAYCELNQLEIRKRLEIFLNVCEAVAYAHRNSVIHRDLKPSNILVNSEGVPKLLDFGIAKLVESESAPTSETTVSWRVMTPEYASPEQVKGEPITALSDIYSLGAVLYELLTGRLPHRVRGRNSEEVKRAICTETPEKPSDIVTPTNPKELLVIVTPESVSRTRDGAVESLRRKLKGDLDNIVLMALRKEPPRRYASVSQFAEDIRRHLAGLPIHARKDRVTYRVAKFVRRNKAVTATSAIVGALCLAVGILLNSFTSRPRTINSIAITPFVNTGNEESAQYLSDGLTDNLINRLTRFPDLKVPAKGSIYRFRGNVDAQVIQREFGSEYVLTGRVTTSGDRVLVDVRLVEAKNNHLVWSQQYAGDQAHLISLEERLSNDVLSKLGLPTSSASTGWRAEVDDEAYRLFLQGNYFWNRRTADSIPKAIQHYEKAILRSPNYALAYDGLAKSYGLAGAYMWRKPEDTFPKAKEAALKALQIDPYLSEAHTTLAFVYWLYDWDWVSADREFQTAIALNPQYVTAHHWYGLYLGEMGRSEESILEEKRAIELDPVSPPIYADLGRVYFFARRYDEALDAYKKTVQMDPEFGAFYEELSYLYEQKGMTEDWFKHLRHWVNSKNEKAYLARDRRAFLRITAETGSVYQAAENYARLGEKDKAFQNLNMALQMRDHRLSQLKVNPVWDPLKSDQRFAELLKRMNLT